jgi:hypothetical protein
MIGYEKALLSGECFWKVMSATLPAATEKTGKTGASHQIWVICHAKPVPASKSGSP